MGVKAREEPPSQWPSRGQSLSHGVRASVCCLLRTQLLSWVNLSGVAL